MKFVIALAFALVAADKSDFPTHNSGHAHCSLSADFAESCDEVYDAIDANIAAWGSAETSPAGGLYRLYEESTDDYIWTTRLTANEKYTDDQLFEFTTTSTGCHVDGKSRSQSSSYYDYDVNFCNMWNVYNGVGDFTNLHHSSCQFYPSDSDIVSTCARY
mmetsp:Transcript_36515/g.26588  ORF Transcript_36515/g.26588 Transcript_36515/m.26588 type:complete len:160 (-) Transcript_36515:78-557(-)|eukprot:CAMPEP_0116870812 /NCGR_PEP_ID=MMETSP0463-20121206/887_1 /TAXON_ID=181622 /ORGANISM="Strombidinopsis sp, Strain SopsisLIS2011" /LENGTH=159 /DNA_ID=CAMNT_0004508057 /DNA_START=25 /DNA_END=504 /DNA_ORIENTATION=+